MHTVTDSSCIGAKPGLYEVLGRARSAEEKRNIISLANCIRWNKHFRVFDGRLRSLGPSIEEGQMRCSKIFYFFFNQNKALAPLCLLEWRQKWKSLIMGNIWIQSRGKYHLFVGNFFPFRQPSQLSLFFYYIGPYNSSSLCFLRHTFIQIRIPRCSISMAKVHICTCSYKKNINVFNRLTYNVYPACYFSTTYKIIDNKLKFKVQQ